MKSSIFYLKSILTFLSIWIIGIVSIDAQCTLACHGDVNLSVSEDCDIRFSLAMFGSGLDPVVCGTLNLTIEDDHGTIYGPFSEGDIWAEAGDFVGQTIIYHLNASPNTCWGNVTIEDKLPPDLDCSTMDVTVSCCDVINFSMLEPEDCSGFAELRITELETVKDCDLGTNIIKEITQSVIAVDKYGNATQACTQTISVARTLIDCEMPVDGDSIGIVWPALEFDILCTSLAIDPDDVDANGVPLNDQNEDGIPDNDTDQNGIPDPSLLSGAEVPYLDKDGSLSYTPGDMYLFPSSYNGQAVNIHNELTGNLAEFCNIYVTVQDIPVNAGGCPKKYNRIWRVQEWYCGEEVSKQSLQTIRVEDLDGPVVSSVPHSFTATTNGYTCEAKIVIPSIEFTDACGSVSHIDVFWDNLDSDLAGSFLDIGQAGGKDICLVLPEGVNEITYTAYDECHQSTDVVIEITVEDNTPPVAICEEHTVASLTQSGQVTIPASTFDDGSYDDCGIKKFLARTMDPSCDCENSHPEFENANYLGAILDDDGEPHHYYLSNFKTLGAKAKKLSKAMGGYAVVYEKESEWQQVSNWVSQIIPNEQYWIGLSDLSNEGTFVWENGSAYDLTNFYDVTSGTIPDNYPWINGYPLLPPMINPFDCVLVRPDNRWWNVGSNRMEHFVFEVEDPCGFGSYVNLCCENTGTNMVVFRVVDKWGNFNECMIEIEAQDKSLPFIECPPDVTVACGYNYGSEEQFGQVVVGQSNVGTFTIPDEFLITPGAGSLWDGYVEGNCNIEAFEQAVDASKMNSCGIGTLIREWKAYNTNTPDNYSSCNQKITFDFEGDAYPVENLTISNPDPLEACISAGNTSVDLSPDVYGYPAPPAGTAVESTCDMLGVTFEDEVFSFNNQEDLACLKVIRKWKIIDWCNPCTFDAADECYDGPVELTQVFKVNNSVAPVLSGTCDDIVLCSYADDCGGLDVTASMSATDDCTEPENLAWSYSVDLDYIEGSFVSDYTNQNVGGTATLLNADNGTSFPIGTHVVIWTFEDRCGNKTSCQQKVIINNCKQAAAYCLDGLSSSLTPVAPTNGGLPTEGTLELWASDFAGNSVHPCGYDIIYSFTADPAFENQNMTFDCDDYANSPLTLEIFAIAVTGSGSDIEVLSVSSCQTTFNITNNDGIDCDQDGNPGFAIISGNVNTEDYNYVTDVEMDLMGSDFPKQMTNESGQYAFPSMLNGGSYRVVPFKNDDPLNGVTTLDVVELQKHILGLSSLASPYKVIAGDINNDKIISTSDLVELRRMILGLQSEFSSNTSWRFANSDYEFSNPTDPLSEYFEEEYIINALYQDMGINFTAMKVGDVNNSVDVNGYNDIKNRNSVEKMTLYSPKMGYRVTGDQVSIPILLSKKQAMLGMQFTMEYNSSQIEFHSLEQGSLLITDANIGIHSAERGALTFSWNTTEVFELLEDEELFVLNFIVLEEGVIDNVLSLNSAITKAEAYNASSDRIDITYDTKSPTTQINDFILNSNQPNPFKEYTTISFTLPHSSNVAFSVKDIYGKNVVTKNIQGEQGYNEVIVDRTDISVAGIYYYTIETKQNTASRKMIVID